MFDYKKPLFLFLLLFSFTTYSQSQNNVSVLLGINQINSTSFGGEIYYLTNLHEKLFMRFSLAYYDFPGRKKLNEEDLFSDISSIIEADRDVSVSLGGRYYLSENNFKPFFDLLYELNYFTNTLEYDRIKVSPENLGDDFRYETSIVRTSDPIIKSSIGWAIGIEQELNKDFSLSVLAGQRFISGNYQSFKLLAGLVYNI